MKTCDEFQGYLFDSVLGEPLPPKAEEALQSHLRDCPDCRKIHEEAGKAWEDLGRLKQVRFSPALSENVLRQVSLRPALIRFLRRPLTFRQTALFATAAVVILVAGLFLIFYRFHPSPEVGGRTYIREAGIFYRGEMPPPDLLMTLDDYLEKTRNILGGIRDGYYNTWGSVMVDIISRDIQGRSNYLLENPDLPATARPVVARLHDAFWRMLQSGRGRETETVRLPPGVEPSALMGEIDGYKSVSEVQ